MWARAERRSWTGSEFVPRPPRCSPARYASVVDTGARAARLPVHATCLGLVGVQSLVAMVRLGIQGKWVHVDVNELGSRKKDTWNLLRQYILNIHKKLVALSFSVQLIVNN